MNEQPHIVPARLPRQLTASTDESLHRVIIHNDDVTPMDLVIQVLMTAFRVPSPNAQHIMYTAHLRGKAHVQTLPAYEARHRVHEALFAARLNGSPLEFSMEAE
jgi:ATP-dependent Clp protease adaptor protein ClpS